MVDEKTGELVFLSVMTSKDSAYAVPIGNFCGFVIILSLIVIEADESRSLMVMKICRCFTGRLTECSDSQLPNSTVILLNVLLARLRIVLINLLFNSTLLNRFNLPL